ncbi:hypothetical protein BZA77DRAFT_319520 [Pyronema omphalodes]|nr:hypothetical protein BZA77DRAFT_319520 [Pyronema omphalodes]
MELIITCYMLHENARLILICYGIEIHLFELRTRFTGGFSYPGPGLFWGMWVWRVMVLVVWIFLN